MKSHKIAYVCNAQKSLAEASDPTRGASCARGAYDTPPNPLPQTSPLNAFGVPFRCRRRLKSNVQCAPPKTMFWIRP